MFPEHHDRSNADNANSLLSNISQHPDLGRRSYGMGERLPVLVLMFLKPKEIVNCLVEAPEDKHPGVTGSEPGGICSLEIPVCDKVPLRRRTHHRPCRDS
jgi:hypothetical protein